MEYPFSSKEKGINYWGSPRTQIDGITSLDGVTRYSALEDPFNNVADLMNFDTYAGWFSSPSMADQMSGSYSFASLDLVSTNCPPLDQLKFSQQSCGSFGVADGDVVRSSVSTGKKMAFQRMDPQFGFLLNPVDGEGSGAKRSSTSCQRNNIMDVGNWIIPRPLERPLAEKMLSALSLFQESSGGGVLAQVWVPIKHGDHYSRKCAVNLRSTAPPQFYPQFISKNQRATLGEIANVLRAVCHAHRLPLALTWISCTYNAGSGDEIIEVRVRGYNTSANEKCILCIEDTACYVNDRETQGFVHACVEHYLQEGQGICDLKLYKVFL